MREIARFQAESQPGRGIAVRPRVAGRIVREANVVVTGQRVFEAGVPAAPNTTGMLAGALDGAMRGRGDGGAMTGRALGAPT